VPLLLVRSPVERGSVAPKDPRVGVESAQGSEGADKIRPVAGLRRWLALGRAGGKPWRQKDEAAQGQAHKRALVHEDGGRGRVNNGHKSLKVKLLRPISSF